jgi:hypothetical protein
MRSQRKSWLGEGDDAAMIRMANPGIGSISCRPRHDEFMTCSHREQIRSSCELDHGLELAVRSASEIVLIWRAPYPQRWDVVPADAALTLCIHFWLPS